MYLSLQRFRRWQIEGRNIPPLKKFETQERVCLNCGETFRGNYCPNCGQSAKTHRLSLSAVFTEFLPMVYNFDTKLLRTILELFSRPGYMMRDYIIHGKRIGYSAPVPLLFVLAAVYIVIKHLLFGEVVEEDSDPIIHLQNRAGNDVDVMSNLPSLVRQTIYVLKYIEEDVAWSSLLATLLYVLPNKLVFFWTELGRKINLTELFYFSVYIACMGLLVNIVGLPVSYFVNDSDPDSSHLAINFLFSWWATKQFFRIGKRRSFRLTMVSHVLMFVFAISIILFVLGLLYLCYGGDEMVWRSIIGK